MTPDEQELHMSSMDIDKNELKTLLKQALIKLLKERNQVLYDALAEIVEEVGLIKAIQEGQTSKTVDEMEVRKALERQA